ncbi:TRAP transporter small permease [Metasolibacillus sp. FSL H7-0170]|uniref:TRAP transporter small permease n=1 Tax=Metasolibacillus sp. FSL H7-0170 TaxID=2921431 RepID=UPI0031583C25
MKFIVNSQKYLLITANVLVALGLFFTVILRYFLKIDLFGIDELLLIPIFLLYFIGGAQGSYEQNHIRADLLESYITSEKTLNALKLFNQFFVLIVGGIIIYWSLNYLIWSYGAGGRTPGWKIPLYIPHGTILIGFILMVFYTLIQFIQQIKVVFRGA